MKRSLLIMLGWIALLGGVRAARADFTAYDDAAWTAGEAAANLTTNSPANVPGGFLLNHADDAVLAARIDINNGAASPSINTQALTAVSSGSDAYNEFNGAAGLDGLCSWQNAAITMTVSGLDSTKRYDVVLYSTRGFTSAGYSNRYTDISISSIGAFTNSSSAGSTIFASNAPSDSVRIVAANVDGKVAKFIGIDPGQDGTIVFTLAPGAVTGSGQTPTAYLNAFKVVEHDAATSHSTTAWKQGAITGVMNANACTLYLYTSNTLATVAIDDMAMVAGSTAEVGTNLIANPGFESGTNAWVFVGNHSISQVASTLARSGAGSLSLHASAVTLTGGSGDSVKQGVLGMTSGQVYTLSFWYYATNALDFVVRYSGTPAMTVSTPVGAGGTIPAPGLEFTDTQFVPGSNMFHMGWGAQAGKAYRVMKRTSLASGSWQSYVIRTATVSSVTLDIPVSGSSGYFRLSELPQAAPVIDNSIGASVIGANSATLNGNLSSTGALPTSVYVCWDSSDKGTSSTGLWAHVDSLGVKPVGTFSDNLSGLNTNTTYYYRCFALNASGSAFATSASSFRTVSLPASAFYQMYASFWDGYAANFASTWVFVSDPVPGNHAPVVNQITANPSSVAALGTVNLSVSATDSDGDPLQYFWVAPGGQLGWSRAANETWKAPSVGTTYKIQVMVGDGKTWTSGYIDIQVTGNGVDDPNGNHPPALTSLVASKTSLAPGETVTLNCTVFDRDPVADSGGGWTVPGSSTITTNPTGTGLTGVTWTAPLTTNNTSGRVTKPGYTLWPRTAPDQASCPIPLSTELVGVGLGGRVSRQQFADTWMPSWGADGDLYTGWQDGTVFTPPFSLNGWQSIANITINGWAKIRGDDPMDLIITAAGQIYSDTTGWLGRYPNVVLNKDGVMYYGTRLTDSAGTMYPAGPNAGFHISQDGGANWTMSPHGPGNYLFPSDAPTGPSGVTRLGQTYLVDLGKNQQHSPDGKVYLVSAGTPASDNNVHTVTDDAVYLCRVTASVANMNNSAAYEVYAGNGNWSSDLTAAQPIVSWTNHISSATITFNPGLSKYIMTCHKASTSITNGNQTSFNEFDSYMLESSSMTGPYKMIQYWKSFGPQAYYLNIPSKFISGDGKSAWLWYAANFSPFDRHDDPVGAGYRLTEQEIRFLTPAEVNEGP